MKDRTNDVFFALPEGLKKSLNEEASKYDMTLTEYVVLVLKFSITNNQFHEHMKKLLFGENDGR
ncbi:hypothetical protein [Burkholderia multivorans]|uniref:hypothetical protein n=1 Tax=Burkholderia multivorans TaxID=87883 RepID=UPI001C21438A|nr:hypothetical protein [Burkholderia multivorans]MBU9553875.1 hypothetical protein [Burkholderia multivorans]